MKNINPIQIWKDGQSKTASVLNANIVADDLQTFCLFYWQLKESDTIIEADPRVEGSADQTIQGQVLAEGNSSMTGEDYQNWDGSNDAAYEFVSGQINVTIATV